MCATKASARTAFTVLNICSTSINNEVVPILVTLGHLGDDSLQLRFPSGHSDEILKLLDEHGIDHSTPIEHPSDPNAWIEHMSSA